MELANYIRKIKKRVRVLQNLLEKVSKANRSADLSWQLTDLARERVSAEMLVVTCHNKHLDQIQW